MCFSGAKAVELLCLKQHRTSADTETRNFKHLSFNIVSFSSLTFCFLWQKNSFVTVIQDLICKLTKACDENSWTKKGRYFTLRLFKCPVLFRCLVLLLSFLPTHLVPQQHPYIFWRFHVAECLWIFSHVQYIPVSVAPAHICFIPGTPTLFRKRCQLVLCHNTRAVLEGNSIPSYT